jgi:hypothetical protein
MQKKLTGWLILLMIMLGPLQFSGAARSLTSVSDAFRPHVADYPRLSAAILFYQLLIGTSIAVWIYTAVVLFRREPGTLGAIQRNFLVGAALRIIGSFSIIAFGGLPSDFVNGMIERTVPTAVASASICGAWYVYLLQSERVRELYA